MNKQTKRLRDFLIVAGFSEGEAQATIRVSKEAGLKFVPPDWVLEKLVYVTKDGEPRDITNEVVESINSQIKEIELEG